MATLTGSTIASSYEQLLSFPDGGLNGTSLVAITDGDSDTACVLELSTTKALIKGSGNKLYFSDEGGEYISGDGTDLTVTSGADILLAPTGNVGIGTTTGLQAGLVIDNSHTVAYHATNSIVTSTIAESVALELRNSNESATTCVLRLATDYTNGSIWDIICQKTDADDGDLIFRTRNGSATALEAMRLDQDGYVGINEGAPSYRLDVTESRDASYCARFTNSQASADASGIIIAAGKASSVDTDGDCVWALLQDGDGTGIATIQYKHSGVTAEFVSTSDERLKENIKDTSVDGLSAINSLNFREFNWIENSNRGQTKIPIGLIAQEVESAGDKCSITKQFLKEQELKNGTKIENVRGIGYDGILLYLAKAVQELSAKVTALENA